MKANLLIILALAILGSALVGQDPVNIGNAKQTPPTPVADPAGNLGGGRVTPPAPRVLDPVIGGQVTPPAPRVLDPVIGGQVTPPVPRVLDPVIGGQVTPPVPRILDQVIGGQVTPPAPRFLDPVIGGRVTPPSVTFSFTLSQADHGQPLIVSNSGGIPNNLYVNLVSLVDVNFPNGPMFGIDLTVKEAIDEIAFGPPFFGQLGVDGSAVMVVPPPLPTGLALFCVGAELDQSDLSIMNVTEPFAYKIR